MIQLSRDIRLAARLFRRRPGVTLTVIGVLGLGIGAASTVFTLINSVLLRPLPYANAGRLVTLWETRPEWRTLPMLSRQWDRIAFSWEDVRAVRRQATTLTAVEFVHETGPAQLTGAGDATEVDVARGSAGLLNLLGVTPAIGRWFGPEEEGAGAPPLAVISDALWAARFGRDPGVLQRTITIDGGHFTVVGVLPPGFRFGAVGPFVTPGTIPDVWVPIGVTGNDTTYHSYNHEVIARLAPGVTADNAARQVDAILRDGRTAARFGVRALPRLAAETGSARQSLWLLFGAAGLLLAMACANAMLLLLGETPGRAREMAVRRALGASHVMLARQLLVEHLLIGIASGAIGAVIAVAAVRIVPMMLTIPLPRQEQLHVDGLVLLFAASVSIASALFAGFAPLVTLARHAETSLRSRGTSPRGVRGQRAVLLAQTSLAMVLLAAGDMLAVTLLRESAIDPGFVATNRLVVRLDLPGFRYPGDTALLQFDRTLTQRLAALPGVSAVTATSSVPLGDRGHSWSVSPDISVKLSNQSPVAQHDEVMPGWFDALGIPVRAGRGFDASDDAGAPLVAVINETMAKALWPGTSPIGRQFLAPNGGLRTVIGVVADVHHQGLADAPEPTFYQSLWQKPPETVSFVVATRIPPERLMPVVRRTIHALDADLPIEGMRSMDRVIAASLAGPRFRAALSGGFAGVAALLLAIGIAGVAAGGVRRRMRELCVRLAVGGTPARVRRLMIGEQLRVVGTGLMIGAVGAAVVWRVMQSALYGAATSGLAGTLVAAVILLSLALAAAWLPTRALGGVDLVRWLRED